MYIKSMITGLEKKKVKGKQNPLNPRVRPLQYKKKIS